MLDQMSVDLGWGGRGVARAVLLFLLGPLPLAQEGYTVNLVYMGGRGIVLA